MTDIFRFCVKNDEMIKLAELCEDTTASELSYILSKNKIFLGVNINDNINKRNITIINLNGFNKVIKELNYNVKDYEYPIIEVICKVITHEYVHKTIRVLTDFVNLFSSYKYDEEYVVDILADSFCSNNVGLLEGHLQTFKKQESV